MISVIIPTFNEESAIERTLMSAIGQNRDVEVIVADGGSSDRTLQIVARFSSVRLVHAPSGRGAAMNAGAAEARGDVLLFLHADTILPPGAASAIEARQRAERCCAGGFRHRFDRVHPLLRIISALHNLRARTTRIYYGDQALFVSRELFEQLGGFQNEFMEDIEFGERLRIVCPTTLLPLCVDTSARRFLRKGIFRATCELGLILVAYNLFRWKLPLRSFTCAERGEQDTSLGAFQISSAK